MAIIENAKKLENEELKDVNGGYLYHHEETGQWCNANGYTSFNINLYMLKDAGRC